MYLTVDQRCLPGAVYYYIKQNNQDMGQIVFCYSVSNYENNILMPYLSFDVRILNVIQT